MTTPSSNLKSLDSQQVEGTSSGFLKLWGVPLAAMLIAAVLAALAWWGYPGITKLNTLEMRISALLKILGALGIVLLMHAAALWAGIYEKLANRIDRLGDKQKRETQLKYDARLEDLHEELRNSFGWRWRGAMPWLMLAGDDALIEAVAPDLKQTGVMRTSDIVLVHAAPNGIDAQTWRRQLRRLRRRYPVDAVIPVVRTGQALLPDDELPRAVSNLSRDLGWGAPIIFLHAVPASGEHRDEFSPVGALTRVRLNTDAQAAQASLNHQLSVLELVTADASVELCARPAPNVWLAQVSQYITAQRERVMNMWQTHCVSKWRRAPLGGVMFAPVFAAPTVPTPVPADQEDIAKDVAERLSKHARVVSEQPRALQSIWVEIGARVKPHDGRRVGFYWPNALAASVTMAAMGWCAALIVSFIGNRSVMVNAQAVAETALAAKPGTPTALRTQLALQQEIDALEYRQQHGAPWHLRAGLNHNDQVLAALWPSYATVAGRNLRDPAARQLEATLTQLAQSRADALPSTAEQQRDYQALKTYLMLAQPQHANAAYLVKQVLAAWPAVADMSAGEWLDTSQRLTSFYASHLRLHPEWALAASNDLTQAARNMLVNQVGLQNSDDTLYQSVLEQAKGKYADMSLATLINGADARGLFTTSQTVPGVYTRAAWDGMISEAIDKAAKEGRVTSDWVLADERAARVPGAALQAQQDIAEVKQRLRARYFAEYAAAWQAMLNSIQWRNASNLSDAITQLTRLTDAQTSPLIALMKSVQYQAQAGRPSQAPPDTLVRKAQDLIGSKADMTAAPEINPLDKPFGPLLALMGDDVVTGSGNGNGKTNDRASMNVGDFSGVSLAHFLTVATTMRLKLQQIATSADAQAMARQMAQAVFQGKLSELTQARDDAALTAASLGSQWSGFGDALFARPLDVAWQTILQPAAASLNEAWRVSVAAPFANTFDGHYPFSDTSSDASFVELGRFIKPDTGLISRFVTTQLAGTLQPQGNAWAPSELAPQTLQFDPEFLAALRQLSTLGAQLYAQGEAGYRFQIMPHPNPDVTRSILTIDGTKIEYFNQSETYTPIVWPGNGQNGHVQLTWESIDAGTRLAFAANGEWAWLRLLGTAQVKPLDSTTYALTFNQANGFGLHYDLKAQVGAGPLDLLKLRGFKMPQRVFLVGKGGTLAGPPSLPPLPPELQP
ncbi:ImcF-related family protein [Caballeronia sp. M1242]|uniref:ImcF-related family protein n=1 Tax=Caballeronia sp. M1242 TaxID=2814653 RepID=UPI0019D1C56C|nr:ImcF-related family protein [Caballeronia sp. M1242]QSN62391.1 type VI secretion protein VasK [Caballeronia sp. M1242]